MTITSTSASILTKASLVLGQLDHVHAVFSSCARTIGMVRRLRRILPNAATRRIYIVSTGIRPILEYACPVWCGGPIAKLVKLQESFCRRHHVMLPPVKKRFDYHTLILFYEIKSNFAPANWTELLPSPSHNSGHAFRKELHPVPLVKKSSYLSSFFATLDYSLEQPTVRTPEEFLS